jgi:hypothetical protein
MIIIRMMAPITSITISGERILGGAGGEVLGGTVPQPEMTLLSLTLIVPALFP